jgi:hypothetical protein
MTFPAWIPWTLALGLGAVSVGAWTETRALERRLAALESAAPVAAAAPEAAPAEGPTLLAGAAPATQKQVEALVREVAVLREQVKGVGGTRGSGPTGEAFEAAVRDVLDKAQGEPAFRGKVAAAVGPALPNKPTFGALAQHLGLDTNQQRDFRRDLEDMQGALFALLAEKRPDGRVLMEEIAAAESMPPNDPKRTQVFLDLFTLKIPGTEETYVARAVTLASGFREQTRRYLAVEQHDRFARLEVDLFGVKMD